MPTQSTNTKFFFGMDKTMELVHHLNAVEPPNSLTPRQQEFCIQFILLNNKAESARQAGYARRNSSSIGCRLLQREDIQSYIDALRREAQRQRNVPTPDTLADEYERAENETSVSLASFLDLSDGVLRLRDPEDLAEHCFSDLENIEFGNDGQVAGYRLKHGGVPSLQRMMQLAGHQH